MSATDLDQLRQQIDQLDERLLELLSQRAALAQQVGGIKKSQAVLRPEREAMIVRRLRERAHGPFPDAAIAPVWREIISACRSLEQIPSVAFLGPVGTFSEEAACRYFGHAADYHPLPHFEAVFQAAESARTQWAVVPIENSSEGGIGQVLDRMLSTDLNVVAEVLVPVSHHVVGLAQANQAQTLLVQPQALAQCQRWVREQGSHLTIQTVLSNAEAARLAALDASAWAIAPQRAAEHYQLEIKTPHVEDLANNTTRFWVLGRHVSGPSGQDKTSLVFSAPNRAGSLAQLLGILSSRGLSMSRLESRPARGSQWEYNFFVDLIGHNSEPAVADALQQFAAQAGWFKPLGSYPRGDQ